jgi:hypothetical protein
MKLSWLYKEYINNNQYRVNSQYPGNDLLDFLIVNNIFYEQHSATQVVVT